MKNLLWSLLLVAACSKPAGGPLKHTFDNTRIAAVPLEAKQSVTEAQQRHDLAQLDRNNASTEYRDAEIEEDLAEYQAEKSVVVSQVVASRHAEAKTTPESGVLARKVADAKVAYMRARRTWLGALSSWTLYEVYSTQAKLELERAKIALANNAAPGVDVTVFETQASAREKAAQTAKDTAEVERKNTEAKLAAWSESEKELLRTAGIQGPVESARYSAEWKSPAPPKPAGEQPAGDKPPAAEPAKP
jgi:hypothetical protein